MYSRKALLRVVTALAAWAVPLSAAMQNARPGIQLLEPIGNNRFIPTAGNEGLGALGFYFGLIYPWLVGLGAATAVLMGLIGGLQILQAGGDSSKRSNGVTRVLTSLGGLLFLLLSATILRVLNPSFFK